MLGKAITEIIEEKAHDILVTPEWPERLLARMKEMNKDYLIQRITIDAERNMITWEVIKK